MFPTNLTTNEVKNAAGSEVEFLRFGVIPPRGLVFHKSGEAPNLPHAIDINHVESGAGLRRIRRSRLGVRLDHLLADGVTPSFTLGYTILQSPVGGIADYTYPTLAMAYLMSLTASLGASTTILYDGTGYGAASLINGTS
jgi:hypothetical protein